jgi:hypothetical protein
MNSECKNMLLCCLYEKTSVLPAGQVENAKRNLQDSPYTEHDNELTLTTSALQLQSVPVSLPELM